MHRLIVALLTAFDAVLAAVVGVAAALALLTMLFVFGFGASAHWEALWPASVAVWQVGNLVPLEVTLPDEYLVVTGISEAAASFVFSLAPLAFAAFTVIFAARSGVRASRAEAWMTGVLTGAVVFAAASALFAVTGRGELATTSLWQAILMPTLLFAVPALIGAVVTEWREADEGMIADLREQVPQRWDAVPALVVRSGALSVVALVGLGALGVAVTLAVSIADVVALYQASGVDLLGAITLTLVQFAYLPTLVVWGIAYVAGPGFAVGAGTVVSPGVSEVAVLPGVPALAALPAIASPWMLLLALLPVAAGAVAGYVARGQLVVAAGAGGGVDTGGAGVDDRAQIGGGGVKFDRAAGADAVAGATGAGATGPGLGDAGARVAGAADAGVAGAGATDAGAAWVEAWDRALEEDGAAASGVDRPWGWQGFSDPVGPRIAIAFGIAAFAAAAVALLSWCASGSIGPERMADFGPHPGWVALAVGVEVLIGAAITLLSPLPQRR